MFVRLLPLPLPALTVTSFFDSLQMTKTTKTEPKVIKTKATMKPKAPKCGLCYKTMRKTAFKSLLESGYMYHTDCIQKQDKMPLEIFCPQQKTFVSSFYPSSKCVTSLSAFYEDYSEGLEPCKNGCHGQC